MRGILLAGGTGTRLYPITRGVSKQLLPIYDKPMIYYPLFTLMAAGIREINIVTTIVDSENFKRLLGDGSQFGIRLRFSQQEKPGGIGQAFLICAEFIRNEKTALILGDNLFYGPGLGREFSNYLDVQGAQVFAYPVSNPRDYGIVNFDSNGNPLEINEKPLNPKSDLAIPGLYFYDQDVLEIANNVMPSQRGEIEITDINKIYLQNKKLSVKVLPRGTAWFDAGSYKNLHDAATFVRIIEERQGIKVACLEEVAWRQKWINDSQLYDLAVKYGESETGYYLKKLLN